MNETMEEALHKLEATIARFDQLDGGSAPSAPSEARWTAIDEQLGRDLSGRRVLVVGPGAPADAKGFEARGADGVVACESLAELEPQRHERFDIVHCNGLLHRVLEPMALLRTLRAVTVENGTLLIGAMVLGDPERSEYLRFVPDRLAGDADCWFVPGRLALRWLVDTAGFRVEAEFGEQEGPRDAFPVVTAYLRATTRPEADTAYARPR